MQEKILQAIDDGVDAVASLKKALPFIEKSAEEIARCFANGNKLLIAGNGGSLCDAAHFAEELTGYFRKKRRALPAIVFNDPGHLTCVGNDAGFDQVFSRGVEALGKEGDIFIGLTTSGNSENLVRAFKRAKDFGLKTIAFLGKGGGRLKGIADHELLINGFSTSDRVQEAHMTAIHIIIEMVEYHLFESSDLLEEMLSTVSN